MDFEKEYKSLVGRITKAHLYAQTDSTRAVLEDIYPSLSESEDERIRKELIDFVNHYRHNTDLTSEQAEWCKKALAWLEKQKDASKAIEAVDRIDKYIDEYLANAHDMKDSNPDKKYYRGWDDALGKMSGILQDVYSDANQKEQKPISTEDMPYITDEHFFEREPADSFKYKLAEYMTKCCTKKEGPYGYEYGISSETILKMAEEELLKRGVVQKPAEWSEEDERMCDRLITRLNWITYNTRTDGTSPNITFFDEIAWLKSLRPQAKQEWNTYDKAIVNCIVCCLDGQFVPEAARKQALEWFNKHRRDFLNSPH